MNVHFDPADAERALREGFAETSAAAMASARTDGDRELVRRQNELIEAVVATARWTIDCHNRGVDMDIATEALGYSLGVIIRSFCSNCPRPAESAALAMDCLMEAVAGTGGGASRGKVTITGERGGHA